MSIFTDLYIKKPKRSKQILDHPYISTTDFGKIIPVLLEDLVPGDIFKCKSALQLKLLPTLAPLMTGIEIRIDYFFVPNRLLWADWEDFITGGENGTARVDHPYIPLDQLDTTIGSLYDYFGLPADIPEGARGNVNELLPDYSINVSALPFRAYDLIYNEYYRDENLEEEVYFSTAEGGDTESNSDILYRNLKKDYFTSALPWAQRGPAVTIPVGQSAPVKGDLEVISDPSGYTGWNGNYLGVTDPIQDGDAKFINGKLYSVDSQQPSHTESSSHQHSVDDIVINNTVNQEQYADLSEATGISINEFRRLNAVQRWLERNARAGSRYVEQILSHFGVRTPDYRLQRPEYLGGEKQIIGMAEVLQTSETANSPQGSRAGVGFGNMLAKTRKYYAQEHGLVLGLMSIIPASNLYADGIQRKWTRTSKFDYFFPEFQFLGEQEILNQELFAYDNPETIMDETFGYTPRYAEYRYHPGEITGQMRSSQAYWHLGRLFNSAPMLNKDFINTGYSINMDQYNRIFPTEEELGDRFQVIIQHFERLKRPMAKNPNPSL